MKPTAQKAIETLTFLKKALPADHLAYWVTPNVILTLAGARPYCDNVFYSDDPAQLASWQAEIAEDITTLGKARAIYWSEATGGETTMKETYAAYDIILADELGEILKVTSLPKGTMSIPTGAKASMDELLAALDEVVRKNDDFKALDNDAIRHISFGILLGYPDKAIRNRVTVEDMSNDPFAEPIIEADIRGARYYQCPQPVYDYSRSLVIDDDITNHEKLWSQVLRDYYTSDFHKALEADTSFQNKLTELDII